MYPHFYNRSQIQALELWARQTFATQIMVERDPLREEKLTDAMHDPTAAATFQFECNFTPNFRAQETIGVSKRRSQTRRGGVLQEISYNSRDLEDITRDKVQAQLLKLTHLLPHLLPPVVYIHDVIEARHFLCTVALGMHPLGASPEEARRIFGLRVLSTAPLEAPLGHSQRNTVTNEKEILEYSMEDTLGAGMNSWQAVGMQAEKMRQEVGENRGYRLADWICRDWKMLGYNPQIVMDNVYPRIVSLAVPLGCVAHIEIQALCDPTTLYNPEKYVFRKG
ncbi:MAG: hypothetical protein GY799_28355, partial [Desulfobulbaceae bacterium]|nr:hypothetical protein [Desulfobulbaceae bacterium]